MNLNPPLIGAFLLSARKNCRQTQAELAEKLCISPQSVSNWECGEAIPDVSVLPDLAAVLRCSVDAILSGGAGCGGFRRHITVAQCRKLSPRWTASAGCWDATILSIIDALNACMNTTIEKSFSNPHIFDVFTVEFLLPASATVIMQTRVMCVPTCRTARRVSFS